MSTIREVAALAGVSLSTVSIVINGQAQARKITPATCEKVWNAVRQLDYKPNIAARKLRLSADSDSVTIALFWANDFRTTMLSRFLQGMQRQIIGDSSIELVVMTYLSGQLSHQRSLLDGRRFHAAIIANASEEDIRFLEQTNLKFPVVLYNRESSRYSYVTVDERKMGQMAAEELLSRGHKNICALTSAGNFTYMRERDEGLLSAYQAAGYPIYADRIIQTDSSLSGGAAACRKALDAMIPCTAIYCASDAIALGALRVLYDRGIQVPEQLSVISIGNGESSYATYAVPALSNIYLPMETMAEKCLELAREAVASPTAAPQRICLPTPFQQRESLGPAPQRTSQSSEKLSR